MGKNGLFEEELWDLHTFPIDAVSIIQLWLDLKTVVVQGDMMKDIPTISHPLPPPLPQRQCLGPHHVTLHIAGGGGSSKMNT